MKDTLKDQTQVTEELSKLRNALYDFTARNPFINVNPQKLWYFSKDSQDTKLAARCYKKARFYQSEYGLETALRVELFLKWKRVERAGEEKFFISPLLYRPCQIVRTRKIETSYHVETEEEQLTINPVLRHYFKTHFDFDPGEFCDGSASFITYFSNHLTEGIGGVPLVNEFNDDQQWQFIHVEAVGIFNYKKSLAGADYETIIASPNDTILQLLGVNREGIEISEVPVETTFLDQTQRMVVKAATTKSISVQGPPGTGKSHTIAAIIADAIARKKKVLFVSEKKSALDVVYKKLSEKGLGYLAARFIGDKNDKRNFYRNLKSAHTKIADYEIPVEEIRFSEVVPSEVCQLYSSLLTKYSPELEGSLFDIVQELLVCRHVPAELEVTGKVPEYLKWKSAFPLLRELEEKFSGENESHLGDQPFAMLDKAVFLENEPVITLEKRLDRILRNLDRISFVQKQYDIEKSLDDFTRLSVAASTMGMVNKTLLQLLVPGSKQYSAFNALSKKYDLLRTRLVRMEKTNARWINKPDSSEISELAGIIQDRKNRSGIRALFMKKSPKLKSAFGGFDSNISDEVKLEMLQLLKQEQGLRLELEEVKIKLKHRFQIFEPDKEIDQIIRLRNKLEQISANDTMTLLEHNHSLDLIRNLDTLHPILSETSNLMRFVLRDHISHRETGSGEIDALRKHIQTIKSNLPYLQRWSDEINIFFKLSADVREFVLSHAENVDKLNAKVLYQTYLSATRFHPVLREISGDTFLAAANASKTSQNFLHVQNLRMIKSQFSAEYRKREKLMTTPASGLSSDDKALKKKLLGQKRLMVHEMSKQQRHLSVKDFFGQTLDSLMAIQPIWMMNPLSVSGYVSCMTDIFDLVIFDEASQIPLEDSIPAIFRAKQIVVAGDSQQMPPSSFFTSATDARTLLTEAESSLPKYMLRWHYRSKHPQLISFSNRVFYENELLALPPVQGERPIEFHKVNGVYEAGINQIEALKVAETCKALVESGKEDIGVFAFSVEQEYEIRQQLKSFAVDSKKIFLRNLENIQGVEFETVVISVGYGPDKDGKFKQNFGPVNRELGANRLNVLFSRASSKMIVIASVTEKDFKMSENRGVIILRDFLHYAESMSNGITSAQADFALGSHATVARILSEKNVQVNYFSPPSGLAVSAFIQFDSGKILLVDPCMAPGETRDIENLLAVLSTRYSAVKIVLSADLWRNFERTSYEIVQFFEN